MSALRTRGLAIPTLIALACAAAAAAAPALTTIQDVLYKADGSRFTGTVQFTWTNFESSDTNPIPTQGVTVNVVNGALKVRLVPTTTASAGAHYAVKYSSQGLYSFTETWAVPPSTTPLRVHDVRVGTGSVVGPSKVTTEVLISDVTGLAAELAARPTKGPGFAASRAAIIGASGQIEAAAGNLTDCLLVDGTSAPCGTTAPPAPTSTVAYVDAETPAGTLNGSNTVFTLTTAPEPVASLTLFRNGILLKQGSDYTLAVTTVTFFSTEAPQSGDLLTASYRYMTTATSSTVQYADAETPAGTMDGSNTAFALAQAPLPAASLQLYRNGTVLKQGVDYTLSGLAITFLSTAVPKAGDIVTAFYRY
jgi:hypothetical protein